MQNSQKRANVGTWNRLAVPVQDKQEGEEQCINVPKNAHSGKSTYAAANATKNAKRDVSKKGKKELLNMGTSRMIALGL